MIRMYGRGFLYWIVPVFMASLLSNTMEAQDFSTSVSSFVPSTLRPNIAFGHKILISGKNLYSVTCSWDNAVVPIQVLGDICIAHVPDSVVGNHTLSISGAGTIALTVRVGVPQLMDVRQALFNLFSEVIPSAGNSGLIFNRGFRDSIIVRIQRAWDACLQRELAQAKNHVSSVLNDISSKGSGNNIEVSFAGAMSRTLENILDTIAIENERVVSLADAGITLKTSKSTFTLQVEEVVSSQDFPLLHREAIDLAIGGGLRLSPIGNVQILQVYVGSPVATDNFKYPIEWSVFKSQSEWILKFDRNGVYVISAIYADTSFNWNASISVNGFTGLASYILGDHKGDLETELDPPDADIVFTWDPKTVKKSTGSKNLKSSYEKAESELKNAYDDKVQLSDSADDLCKKLDAAFKKKGAKLKVGIWAHGDKGIMDAIDDDHKYNPRGTNPATDKLEEPWDKIADCMKDKVEDVFLGGCSVAQGSLADEKAGEKFLQDFADRCGSSVSAYDQSVALGSNIFGGNSKMNVGSESKKVTKTPK